MPSRLARQLSVSGSRLIYTNDLAAGAAPHDTLHGGTAAVSAAANVAAHIVQNYALGYKYAMFTGAGLALTGALASLTRPTQVQQAPRPPLAPTAAPNER